MGSKAAWTFLALVATAFPAVASDFYVSPTGSASNNGSVGSPWDLQTALNQPAAVRPGDTIWLRGGTYIGAFRSNLVGAAGSPIIVRQYPGERARLDGNTSAAKSAGRVLAVYGAHTWFWGFEVTSSETNPTVEPSGPNVPEGIVIYDSHHIKLINLIVHDMVGQGIAFWSENSDSEIEGCIVYYNGLNAWDHGIYLQNQVGTKKLMNNVIFQQASHGIHGYGSTAAYLDNIHLEGNTVFNSGMLNGAGGRNILLGGGRVAANPVVKSNYTYFSGASNNSNIGYLAGTSNGQVTGNYFIAGNVALRLINYSGTFTGNFLTGETDPSNMASLHPSNTYLASRPTSGTTVFVRPNAHEAGRAHITVYNWAKTSTVSVNLAASGLANGTPFEIRDAQNFFGEPVLTATYTGNPVPLPMTGLSSAAPVRFAAPAHTSAEFGTFVLIPLGAPSLPAAPSNLNATAASSTQINLAWTDNSSNETGFEIERGTSDSGPWAPMGTVGANVTSASDPGRSPSTTTFYRVRAISGAGPSAWSNVAGATTPAGPPPPPPPPSGSGLKGEYFNNLDFTSPVLTRTDAVVDFNWGTGSPDPAMGVDTYSVRWSGRVQAPATETVTFYTVTDDGVRLRVNGQLIIDRWIDQPATEWSGAIALVGGTWYSIVLEYYENGGDASARLLWSSPSLSKQVVPSNRLSPVHAGGTSSPNLLANPGFESGSSPWSGINGGTIHLVNGPVRSGTQAVGVSASGSASPSVRQTVGAGQGKSYAASAWVKTQGLLAGAKVRVAWRNSSGSTLRTDTISTVTGTSDWTLVTRTMTAPAGTTQASFQLMVALEADGLGAAWFDDASLSESSGAVSMSADLPDPDDVDADGLLNEFEAMQGLNPQLLDGDGDSMSDDQEFTAGGWTYEETQAGESVLSAGPSEGGGGSGGCGLVGLEGAILAAAVIFGRRRRTHGA